MSPEQRSFFQEKGYLLLKSGLTREQVRPFKASVLDELKRLKIWSSGKIQSAPLKNTPAFQQVAKLSGLIKLPDLESRLMTPDLISTITSLAGRKVTASQSQLLISLAKQGDWTLQGLNWHTDTSGSSLQTAGIQAFVLLDDIFEHGGATLALAGSHVLTHRSATRRKILEIFQKQADIERELQALNLSLLEMSGQAGDVYLMDMRLLHTPSINATQNLRIAATVRYFFAER